MEEGAARLQVLPEQTWQGGKRRGLRAPAVVETELGGRAEILKGHFTL